MKRKSNGCRSMYNQIYRCWTFKLSENCIYCSNLTGSVQADMVMTLEQRDGCFESSHGRSNFPHGSLLLTAVAFLKNDVYCCFTNKGSRDKRFKNNEIRASRIKFTEACPLGNDLKYFVWI